jgi:hypothetical protein
MFDKLNGNLDGNSQSVVWSRDGLFVGGKTAAADTAAKKYGVLFTRGTLRAMLDSGTRQQVWQATQESAKVEATLSFRSELEEDGKAGDSFQVGMSFGTNLDGSPPLQMHLCVVPTVFLNMVTKYGGRASRITDRESELLRIETATGAITWDLKSRRVVDAKYAPKGVEGVPGDSAFAVRSRPAAWKEAQEKMQAAMSSAAKAQGGFVEWAKLLQLLPGVQATLDELSVSNESVDGWALLADLGADYAGTLFASFGTGGKDAFSVPARLDGVAAINPTAAMMAMSPL